MTDIVAANVSYSFNIKDKQFKGRRGFSARGTISFGNGSLTYPSGGIPLTKAKIGLPRVLRSVEILGSNASLYQFEFDYTNSKIRLFQSPAGSVSLSSNSAGTASGNVAAPTISFTSNSGNVAADKVIGVNALSNGAALVANTAPVNVIGVQAPAFTGDALSAHTHTATGTAGRFFELSGGSTAVQACVLEVDCEGY